MLRIKTRLEELEKNKTPICIAVIGAGETDTGQRGSTLIEQIERIPGMTPLIVVDDSLSEALNSYKKSGITEKTIEIAKEISGATKAISQGKRVVSKNFDIAGRIAHIDIVLVAIKDSNNASEVAFKSILEKKHVIMLNALTDVTVGPLLKLMANNVGVVYTFSAGDEPGVILELCNFAWILGFQVVAAGKGKNNPLHCSVTPYDLREASQKKKISPETLVSFVDGTKTMLEMTALANATGLVPDKRGMHGHEASVDDLLDIFCLKSRGGILSREGVVDYVVGGDVAPGVFVIVRSEQKSLVEELDYLKMGKGPNYLLYRPFHLGNLETPLSIAKAFFDREPSIAPLGYPFAETIAVAKRNLKVGEKIDGIGGSMIYGTIEQKETAEVHNLLPLGLAERATLLSDVMKNCSITRKDVQIDECSFISMLRRLQDILVIAKS